MKVDLPELNRCCFCIPLRYGLIGWGYIKLLLTLPLITVMAIELANYIVYTQRNANTFFIVEVSIFIFCMAIDFCFVIIFLVGGHLKTVRLLHIYYVYSIVMLCVFTIYYTLTSGVSFYYLVGVTSRNPEYAIDFLPLFKTIMLLGVFFIGIQVYIILLTRNEINKLNNKSQFRFTNVAAEAQCSLETGTNDQGFSGQ